MPDAPPPHWTDPALDDHPAAGPLTPDRIAAILADFRDWLEGLGEVPDNAGGETSPVDLGTLVEQFTALRHEVHLQTRAARTATEQSAEALKLLAPEETKPESTEALRPLVMVLLDVADALSVSLQQVEIARAKAGSILADLTTAPDRGGFLAWLRGRPAGRDRERQSLELLQRLLAGVADGYALSLRRVQRGLSAQGVAAVASLGQQFNPDRMEVLEVVSAPDRPSGTVVEEVRGGYEWNGKPLRAALVKVAR
jgi:molecular chaperone GrpE